MKRREALAAKMRAENQRRFMAWDFLLGVEDARAAKARSVFAVPKRMAFLAHEALTVPPVAKLTELETVAREISAKAGLMEPSGPPRQWHKVLDAPGASLGGARPKASFSETNGSLWIAKFPAADDARDVGAWEARSCAPATCGEAGIRT